MPDATKPAFQYQPTHCLHEDCPGEPVADTHLCADHLAELERFERAYWGEVQHQIDERRGH